MTSNLRVGMTMSRNRIHRCLLGLVMLLGLVCLPGMAAARDKSSHWAVRGVAEVGMGTLFGAAVGGGALVTGAFIDPKSLKTTMAVSAALYPAAVASGAILGGHLTKSKSNYWAPFVGAYAGAAVADVTAYFLSDEYPTLSAVLVIVLPIVSTVVAMECSHYFDKSPGKGKKTETVVMPLSYGFAF